MKVSKWGNAFAFQSGLKDHFKMFEGNFMAQCLRMLLLNVFLAYLVYRCVSDTKVKGSSAEITR